MDAEGGAASGATWYDSDVIFWNQGYLLKRDVRVLSKSGGKSGDWSNPDASALASRGNGPEAQNNR